MPKGERGTSKPFLRGEVWWIQYYVPGEAAKRRESSGSKDKKDAIRLLNQRRSEADKRQMSVSDATVANLLDLFLTDQRQKKRKSFRSVEGFVRIHLKPAFGKVRASDVTTDMISRFITQKQSAGHADASVNRYLSALRRAFILGRDALPPLVSRIPKIPILDESANVRQGFLEHAEYLRMRDELPGHQQLVLVIGYHLGMRLGEILSLRWNQVDWDENMIRLDKHQTKGRQARNAPLYGELRVWLEMASADPRRGSTIVSYEGEPISEVKTAWGKARERAGLPNLLRHDLRRTAIRNMKRAGISEHRAMLISGHKDPSVFRRYDITDERDTREDGQKMAAYLERKAAEAKVLNVGTGKVGTKVGTLGDAGFSGGSVN